MPESATMQRLAQPHAPEQQSQQEPLPTRSQLASWWKQFKKGTRGEGKVGSATTHAGIFGVPLETSIRYANVAISLFDNDGRSFIYGYVPIVVAKCGVFLKEKATDVEGIFRLAGAERRIKELQTIFNSPSRYGKGLDWTGYTVHDAANILRRYLNQLPEPVIPLSFYDRFREPLRHHQAQAVGEMEMQKEAMGEFNPDETIRIFQQLITELPPLNRQLLLYILDLLAVFASKADVNLMTAPNLSAIFQPGILSHPSHDMAPEEYRLSQDVLIFLIENQDNFLVGMQGTAADEKTIQDVQNGPPADVSTAPAARPMVGRSASSASAGSESARKYSGLRRNISVNSRGSRQSNHSSSPAGEAPSGGPLTPTGKASGIHRSNTVPSKKSNSPALTASERFQASRLVEAQTESLAETNETETTAAIVADIDATPPKPHVPSPQRSPRLSAFAMRKGRSSTPVEESKGEKIEVDAAHSSGPTSPALTPSKERGLSSFFRTSPSHERDRSEGRKPNKLHKRRAPDELGAAPISQASLTGGSYPPSPSAAANFGSMRSSQSNLDVPPTESLSKPPLTTNPSFHTAHEGPKSPPISPIPAEILESADQEHTSATSKLNEVTDATAAKDAPQRESMATLKPKHSPAGSITSRSTGNELSSAENEEADVLKEKKEKRHHRWKFSMSSKKPEDKPANDSNLASTGLGSVTGAELSNSSVASLNKAGKAGSEEASRSGSIGQALSGSDAEGEGSSEKRGPLGWFRGKWHERKEKEAERERAKSPPPAPIVEEPASEYSLNAAAMATTPSPPLQLQPPLQAPETATAPGPIPQPVTETGPLQPSQAVTTAQTTEAAPQTSTSGPVQVPIPTLEPPQASQPIEATAADLPAAPTQTSSEGISSNSNPENTELPSTQNTYT